MMSSANKDSIILSNVSKPEIFLISDRSFGGYFFGTGVDISNLYTLGYSPLLILVLMMSVRGSARYAANIFVSLTGKSPATVDLFFFQFC